ncbi:unnamed protein product [Musa textilis]
MLSPLFSRQLFTVFLHFPRKNPSPESSLLPRGGVQEWEAPEPPCRSRTSPSRRLPGSSSSTSRPPWAPSSLARSPPPAGTGSRGASAASSSIPSLLPSGRVSSPPKAGCPTSSAPASLSPALATTSSRGPPRDGTASRGLFSALGSSWVRTGWRSSACGRG